MRVNVLHFLTSKRRSVICADCTVNRNSFLRTLGISLYTWLSLVQFKKQCICFEFKFFHPFLERCKVFRQHRNRWLPFIPISFLASAFFLSFFSTSFYLITKSFIFNIGSVVSSLQRVSSTWKLRTVYE